MEFRFTLTHFALSYFVLFFFCFEVVDLRALLFANFCELERDLLHSSLPTVDSPSDYLFCPSILRLKETLFHCRLQRDYVPIQVLEQLMSSWNGAKKKKRIYLTAKTSCDFLNWKITAQLSFPLFFPIKKKFAVAFLFINPNASINI